MLDLFIPVFLAAIVLVLKPGPYIMAFTSLALDGRWKAMLIFWLGSVTAGTAIYFLLLGAMNILPDQFGLIFIFIKAAAAVLFVSMGLLGLNQSISDYQTKAAQAKETMKNQSFFKTVFSGFLLTLSNPYDIVFILAAIPAITGLTSFSFMDIAVIRGAVVSADVLVLLGYCLPLLFMRSFLNDQWLRRIKVGTSVVMVGIGLYLFASIIIRWDLNTAQLL